MENLLNVNQVAFILKVHPLTIRRYIREEKLLAVKAGGSIRIRETDLAAFTKKFQNPPKQPINILDKQTQSTKSFSADDPLLRMEGRGASLTVK